LFSNYLPLENVKTLRLMDCNTLEYLKARASVMPNVVSIQFAGNNTHPYPLGPVYRSSPVLFPRLKHISGLTGGMDLVEMVRLRKANGGPLAALDVRGYRSPPKRIAELKKLVERVKVWDCTDLPKHWTSNPVFDTWERSGHRVPVSAGQFRRN
jgi:hypothetical protein